MRYLFLSFFLVVSPCMAEDHILNTITQNSITHNTIVGKADDWGLNEQEWQHYLFLMHGPSGYYYTYLTPAEVLGINAENIDDLKHFAEVTVKQEHAKIERELRFNVAFQEAAQRVYVEEPIIRPFDMSPYSSIQK